MINRHTLINRYEYSGKFWIPNISKTSTKGKFIFIPGTTVTIELDGIFAKNKKPIEQCDIINGQFANGELVTLIGCFILHHNFLSENSKYSVEFCIIGENYEKLEDVLFEKVNINYSRLNEWLTQSSIHNRYVNDNRGNIKLNYKFPKKKRIKVSNEICIEVTYSIEQEDDRLYEDKYILTEIPYISFKPSTRQSFKYFQNYWYKFQNFLSLACMEPVSPVYVRGCIMKNIDGSDLLYPVDILYALWHIPELKSNLYPRKMLFHCFNIQNDIIKIIKNWYGKLAKVEAEVNLYFNTVFQSNMYLENRFLNLIQAIESFHRKYYKNIDLSQKEHAKRIDSITKSIPKEYKKWVEDKLAYSNEPNLRKRLKEIFIQYNILIEIIIGSEKKRKSFINKIMNLRNYFTHYSQTINMRDLEPENLYWNCEKLKIIFEILILNKIGFSQEQINKLFSNYSNYKQLYGF